MLSRLVKLAVLPLAVCFLFSPVTSFAWNALGHMVVADIAYQRLKPEVRDKVDKLISFLHNEYPDINSMQQMAYWPDTIRSQKVETFTHWHYIDQPYIQDGVQLKNLIDSDNIVWAINRVRNVVGNQYGNSYERARFLAFLAHFVGDIHQPLHTTSLLSKTFPNGDRGGNSYRIRYNNKITNLHSVWDKGLGYFDGPPTQDRAKSLAILFMSHYPENYFGDKVNNISPTEWAKEGFDVAKTSAYSTPLNQPTTKFYDENGRQVVEQRIALAGYRLAAVLNQLLQ